MLVSVCRFCGGPFLGKDEAMIQHQSTWINTSKLSQTSWYVATLRNYIFFIFHSSTLSLESLLPPVLLHHKISANFRDNAYTVPNTRPIFIVLLANLYSIRQILIAWKPLRPVCAKNYGS